MHDIVNCVYFNFHRHYSRLRFKSNEVRIRFQVNYVRKVARLRGFVCECLSMRSEFISVILALVRFNFSLYFCQWIGVPSV